MKLCKYFIIIIQLAYLFMLANTKRLNHDVNIVCGTVHLILIIIIFNNVAMRFFLNHRKYSQFSSRNISLEDHLQAYFSLVSRIILSSVRLFAQQCSS